MEKYVNESKSHISCIDSEGAFISPDEDKTVLRIAVNIRAASCGELRSMVGHGCLSQGVFDKIYRHYSGNRNSSPSAYHSCPTIAFVCKVDNQDYEGIGSHVKDSDIFGSKEAARNVRYGHSPDNSRSSSPVDARANDVGVGDGHASPVVAAIPPILSKATRGAVAGIEEKDGADKGAGVPSAKTSAEDSGPVEGKQKARQDVDLAKALSKPRSVAGRKWVPDTVKQPKTLNPAAFPPLPSGRASEADDKKYKAGATEDLPAYYIGGKAYTVSSVMEALGYELSRAASRVHVWNHNRLPFSATHVFNVADFTLADFAARVPIVPTQG